MASNLAAIGFPFRTRDELEATLLPLAADAVEQLDCAPGSYLIWRSRTGAEIWFHVAHAAGDPDAREIRGLTPFFSGDSEAAVEIVGLRPDDSAFEGEISARHAASGRDIVFEAVDFAAHARREPPFVCRAQLLLCAHLAYLRDDGSPPETRLPGHEAFRGTVLETRRFVNEATSAPFDWLSLQSGSLVLDVVAEPGVLPGNVAPGAIATVAGALLGRLIG